MLFADTEFVSPHLVPALVGSLVFVLVGVAALAVFLPVAMKLVDRHTPGKLADQLVPNQTGTSTTPNVALAIVVGLLLHAMVGGVAAIIAAAIH